MHKYIIIDDEPLAHDLIVEFCGMIPHVELVAQCYDAFEAMKFINGNKVDFMFLDINMPKLSGFEFLKTLTNPPKVIVTTAYKEFAIEGYTLNVVDYLLKPFSVERLIAAVNKAIAMRPDHVATARNDNSETSFFVKGDKKHHHVFIKDILYVEAYGNYTKLHLSDETILTHERISHFEGVLKNMGFIRIHKSFIVSKNKISLIEGNRIFIKGHEVPIGQTYRSVVKSMIK